MANKENNTPNNNLNCILIIEDEPSIADNISYSLTTDGFGFTLCSTGSEALKAVKESSFSLIIMDIGLPDINGFDLAKKIQSEVKTPFIFLTARSDEIDKVAGLELGADDYIVKPFSPRELTARVRAVLRRTTPSHSEEQNTQDNSLVIDDSKMKASYYGTALELTRYEFRLLKALATSPGRVFTREQLMDKVWEEPDMSMDRTVDTHIKTLRQKLKQIKEDEEAIVTHRGIGYSFKESQ